MIINQKYTSYSVMKSNKSYHHSTITPKFYVLFLTEIMVLLYVNKWKNMKKKSSIYLFGEILMIEAIY